MKYSIEERDRRIQEILSLEDEWGEYGDGKSFKKEFVQRAVDLEDKIMEAVMSMSGIKGDRAVISALEDGTLDLYWKCGESALLINMDKECTFFATNGTDKLKGECENAWVFAGIICGFNLLGED